MPRLSEVKENHRTKNSIKQKMARLKQICKKTGRVIRINPKHSPKIIEENNSTLQKSPLSNNPTTKNTNSEVEVIKAIETQSPKKIEENNSTSQTPPSSNNPTTENTDSEVEVIEEIKPKNPSTDNNAIRSVCCILSFV